jgi:hypothetical protein
MAARSAPELNPHAFPLNPRRARAAQNGRVASWCTQIGNNARRAGSDSINIVMTQYWMPVSTVRPRLAAV